MPQKTSNYGIARLCRWAIPYALRRRLPLIGVLATMLIKVGLDVIKPWPMVFLVDHVLRDKASSSWLERMAEWLPGTATQNQLIAWTVAATLLIFLLSWAVSLVNACANISLGQRMIYDLAADLFSKLQQLSLRFHTSKSVGDNLRRVTADCACVSIIIKDALLPVLASLVTVAAMFGVLWQLDRTLTILALMVVPLMLATFYLHAQPMLVSSSRQQEEESRIYGIIEQTFSAMPVVQAFCREDLNHRRFAAASSATLAATLSLTNLQLRFKVLMGLTTAVGTAGILWLGTRHALEGTLSIGTILLFLSYLSSLYEPLATVMYTSTTIQAAAGSVKRVQEVLETECEVRDRTSAARIGQVNGRIQIENVTFGYEPGRPVLRGISLEVKPGEIIALVGSTGAGKSTVAALIPRFFDPWEGRVLIDGRDVRDAQLKSLRANIAIVLQEPFLFPLSVAENIAYGRPGATFAEIEEAGRAANAHDFILRLPQGYHTVIGERGATLSGGERQRLSIARALLKNAPILILDEPTSALDAESEQLLLEALDRLTRGRSTLIIAHRLSTVRRANRLLALRNGVIAESGSHSELLARGGIYAAFYEAQFGTAPISQNRSLSSLEV